MYSMTVRTVLFVRISNDLEWGLCGINNYLNIYWRILEMENTVVYPGYRLFIHVSNYV